MHKFTLQLMQPMVHEKILQVLTFNSYLKQEAQWACIAYLVFAILYHTMTKGCYMQNINAIRPVID